MTDSERGGVLLEAGAEDIPKPAGQCWLCLICTAGPIFGTKKVRCERSHRHTGRSQ